ncbi:hypothetical protein ACQPZF_01045 [Actinosynnema sp. CS-041913]|uniref:hypothetical protein n=1 Tax=Actinosynnema sp. CS-041913 TaxID=3239917 RepID=UPI003D919E03
MSDGNTVPLTQAAPVSAPPPVPADTSTTQVITPDVLAGLTPAASPFAPPVAPVPTADAVTTGVVNAGPAPDPSSTQVITGTAGTPNFASVAQADLQKATTALDAVDKRNVQLDLDKQAVRDLVTLIAQARNLVDNVHTKAVNDLDVELQFGKNWVGEAISRRLREVAVGNDASAVNVIGDFMQVLFEVEETIRDAARNLEEADDDAAEAFNSAEGEVKGP